MYHKVQLGDDLVDTFANITRAESELQAWFEKDQLQFNDMSKHHQQIGATCADIQARLDALDAHVNKIAVATVDDAARAFLYWSTSDPAAFGAALAKIAKEAR